MSLLDTLLEWDESALARVHRWPRRPALTSAMTMASRLGDPDSWALLGIAVAVAGGPRGRRLALRGLVAASAATVAAGILKRVLNRPRPREKVQGLNHTAEDPDAFSFPSGHTAAAVAVATAWAGTRPGHVMAPLAVTIAASRVYLGAHYPLDVAAGAVIGLVAGLTAHAVSLEPPTPALPAPPPPPAVEPQVDSDGS